MPLRPDRPLPCGAAGGFAILDGGVPRFVINTQHTRWPALWWRPRPSTSTGSRRRPAIFRFLGRAWSLSVEEVFYLFFPLVCLPLRSRPHCRISIVLPSDRAYARAPTPQPALVGIRYPSTGGIALGCLAAMLAGRIKLGDRTNLALRISGVVSAFYCGVSVTVDRSIFISSAST